MRRRQLDRFTPEGVFKPSAVLQRRRRRRCLFVAGLSLIILVAIVCSFTVLARFFNEQASRIGGGHGQDDAVVGEDGKRAQSLGGRDAAGGTRLPAESTAASYAGGTGVGESQTTATRPREGEETETAPSGTRHPPIPRAVDENQFEEDGPPQAPSQSPSPTPPAHAGSGGDTRRLSATDEPPVPSSTPTNTGAEEGQAGTPKDAVTADVPTAPSVQTSQPSQRPSEPVPSPPASAAPTTEEVRPSTSPMTKAVLRLYPRLRLLSCRSTDAAGGAVEDEADDCLRPDAPRKGGPRDDLSETLPPATASALGLPFEATDTVAPLHKMKVEMYRQRVDRDTWWRAGQTSSPTGEGGDGLDGTTGGDRNEAERCFAAPIVALRGTYLPVTHFFPRELLVEDLLSGDDGLDRYPDPSRLMPMEATARKGSPPPPHHNGEDGEEEELAEVHLSPKEAATPHAAPVLRLYRRTSGDAGQLPSSRSDDAHQSPKLSFVSAQWLPVPSATAAHSAIDVDLFTVRPVVSRAADAADGEWDTTRTTSLAGTFTFRNLRRLYGLPGAVAAAVDAARADQEGAEAAAAGSSSLHRRFTIPRDGFHHVASVRGRDMHDYTPAPGVMPLIFADLDGEATPAGSEAERTTHATRTTTTVGILWLSSAPFSVRTQSSPPSSPSRTTTLTLSSSAAETRVYLLPGPTHADVLRQYYTLTGFPLLPPVFAMGYHHHFHTDFSNTSHHLRSTAAGEEGESVPPNSDAAPALSMTLQSALQEVNSRLLAEGVPVDSIGFTTGAVNQRLTPFSWQAKLFPDPERLQTDLWLHGRRFFFVRTSPHIPVLQSSPLYQEGKARGYFVSADPDDDTWYTTYPRHAAKALLAEEMGYGLQQEGHPERGGGGGGRAGVAAPIRTHVIDFFHPHARRWFGGMLKLKRFTGSTNKTFVVLADAAPDALMGDGLSLPMSTGHYGGTHHRQVHNAFSTYYVLSAFHGLMRRTKYMRRAIAPTEGFFVGVQRFGGAVGLVPARTPGEDRQASTTEQGAWRRLRSAISDVLALSMSGVPFAGANAAGFEGDLPSSVEAAPGATTGAGEAAAMELVVRWYQAASVFPFMRAEEGRGLTFAMTRNTTAMVEGVAGGRLDAVARALSSRVLPLLLHSSNAAAREAITLRYAILPYLYTSLWRTSETGQPLLSAPSFLADQSNGSGGERRDDANVCVSVGAALVACPITTAATSPPAVGQSPAHTTVTLPPAAAPGAAGDHLYDLYSGRRFAAGESVPVALAWRTSAPGEHQGGALAWLGDDGLPTSASTNTTDLSPQTMHSGAAAATGQGDVVPSRLPLFLREGHILPTFTSFAAARQSHWSTHVPSNVSLTLALPPNLPQLLARSLAPADRDGEAQRAAGTTVVLATGELYWDEGSENSQVTPPPSTLPAESDEDEDEALHGEARPARRRAFGTGGEGGNEQDNSEDRAAALQAEIRQRKQLARAEARRWSQRQRRAKQRLRAQSHHCHVRVMSAFVQGNLVLHGRLVGAAAEGRCREALRRLEASWNEVPRLTLADHRVREAAAAEQRHAQQREREAAADRGEHRLTDRGVSPPPTPSPLTEGGLANPSPQAVLPTDAFVSHNLASALQLRYIRFLTATAADAQWLAQALRSSDALSLVKEEPVATVDASPTLVAARVVPRIHIFGHRLPASPSDVADVVEPWRLTFTPTAT